MSKTATLPKPEAQDQQQAERLLGAAPGSALTFQEHKERTASDCEQVAKMLTDLAAQIREGNLKAFESWWIEGGTEEGDAKCQEIRERLVLRYLYREEHVQNPTLADPKDSA